MPLPGDITYEAPTWSYGGFAEGDLIERAAIDLFKDLGWTHLDLMSEFGSNAYKRDSVEGRPNKRHPYLANRLRAALRRLNPTVPEESLDEAIEILTSERPFIEAIAANREVHGLLKDGLKVKVRQKDGSMLDQSVRVVDWQDVTANEFVIASQVWFAGELYTRRADLVGYVNGVPLLLVELKALYRSVEDAFLGNLRDYRTAVPQLFVPLGFVMLSNGIEAKLGSPLAGFEHFAEWKKIDDEEEPGVVSLETMIRGTCRSARFLDLIENFIVFQEGKHGLVKKLAKNHQVLGVNRALAAVDGLEANRGRLGVFWHTQGSGKSLSMLFFAAKVLRTRPGNWTFVIVTDRTELDDQIADTFSDCGVLVKPRQTVQAQTRGHLRTLLAGDERFIFTLIQKFGTERGDVMPVLSERSDIIVITDEAHRSQYAVLAANMRAALPNAAFLGFTGTPLIAGEDEKTREVFGDYVSVYDFAQSIADGATVPLYYESRLPELQLDAEDLEDKIAEVIEEAGLDEEAEEKLTRSFARAYALITNDDRLERVAEDLVSHFAARGYRGKAMFVAIDKATAVRMHEKVQRHWKAMLVREDARIAAITDPVEKSALEEQLAWLRETDMAVVVSQSQNENDAVAKFGLDIRPHRKRMVEEDLDEKFKSADDPLRLVFVCAMWITGFDVPTCSTVYLDKPMKNHTLMQTIARANRVAPGKQSGLIVDYVGIFRNLKQALAIYAKPRPDDDGMPIKDKEDLVEELKQALEEALAFAAQRGLHPDEILAKEGFARQAAVKVAAEAVLDGEDSKKTFLRLVARVWSIFKAVLPDPRALEHRGAAVVLQVVAETVRALGRRGSSDLSEVLAEIERLIDSAIKSATIKTPILRGDEIKSLFDLSSLDFEKLAALFSEGSKKTAVEAMTGKAEQRARELTERNPTRAAFVDRLQALIDRYNTGTMEIERLFEELKQFIRDLDDEEQRHVREGLDEEELAIFDILTNPEPKLTQEQEVEVKKIAKELLTKLKREKFVLDWRTKDSAKAGVRQAIREELDVLPDVYDRKLWEEKVERTYQFVFERAVAG